MYQASKNFAEVALEFIRSFNNEQSKVASKEIEDVLIEEDRFNDDGGKQLTEDEEHKFCIRDWISLQNRMSNKS